MSIRIQSYTDDYRDDWDHFVRVSRLGTVFHTRTFLSYHPSERFMDASVLFLEGEKIVGVLPAAVKENVLLSHPGASYGGLVTGIETSVAETGAMLTLLVDYAKATKLSGVSMLRLPPTSLQKMYAEDQPYWLYQKGFTMTRSEMDGAIDLRLLTGDAILDSLTGKCRNMVRQAERAEVTVKLSNDFASFWPILDSVLTGRHGTKPTHTLAEIQKLHQLLPEEFRLLAAHKGELMVGGIVLVTIHDKALYTLYMAQEYEAQKDHPMHLLLVEAMKLGFTEGKDVLHLGVSTEDGGRTVNEGLFFFKESFGCRPVRRETWEITF